jgi:hypothetical protein
VRLAQDPARAALAVALSAATLLTGCLGGSDDRESAPAQAGARIGEPVRVANCRDWRDAPPRERRRIVDALREFIGGPGGSPRGHGPTLPDKRAYALFDTSCGRSYARGFRLYKLYVRAASFTEQKPSGG